jgi:hypothetical protein
MRILVALAIAWLCTLARPAVAQPSSESATRAYGLLRLGPVGQTVVRTPTRELDGAPVAAPGLGLRIDQPVLTNLLVGLDLALLFEGENALEPHGPDPYGTEFQLDGLVLDVFVSARPLWKLDRGRIELFASGGIGVTLRPAVGGELPYTDESGATQADSSWSASGWGVLAQVGAGATFWLSERVGVLFEAAVLARRVTAFAEDEGPQTDRADFVLVVDELHGTLLIGVGGAWGGR